MTIPMPIDQVLVDRRRSPRRAVSQRVKLELHDDAPGDHSGLLVTDISDGGVRLFAQSVELPETFALVFVDSGIRRACKIVWRIGPEAGVKFIEQLAGASKPHKAGARGRGGKAARNDARR